MLLSATAVNPVNQRKRMRENDSDRLTLASSNEAASRPLPPQIILLMLPTLLAHPPSHPLHICSLRTMVSALRRCLSLQNLSPDEECQACLGLAEVGMKVVGAGLHQKEGSEWRWARGVDTEIDKALGRGLMLCEKHQMLRIYKVHLTCLNAKLGSWQQNTRLVRSQLRRLQDFIYPTDPSYLHYMTHLSLISIAASSVPPDFPQALQQTKQLKEFSVKQGDSDITLLADVEALKLLIDSGIWAEVPAALAVVGERLELCCLMGNSNEETSQKPMNLSDPFRSAMAIHSLFLGVIHYTQVGAARQAASTLGYLHALLDEGVLDKFPDGFITARVKHGPQLRVELTHPKTLLLLAFLVSSTSKRDCVGRRPRRKVFAEEGMHMAEREAEKNTKLSNDAGLRDLEGVELTLLKIKADLMCELVSVATIRSEFERAESLLAELICFLRAHKLFPSFSARVALHHGHVAHALGRSKRAAMCYQVSAYLAGEGTWIWAAARTGEIGLQVGLTAGREQTIELGDDLRKWCNKACGTLQGVAKVIDSCIAKEITKSKQCLKASLDSATAAQDNHLRALILALTSYHYFHTSIEHSIKMLQTARQLAAGMGAPEKPKDAKEPDDSTFEVTGNAALGLWIGERFLELYNRQGRTDKIEKQKEINLQFQQMMADIAARG